MYRSEVSLVKNICTNKRTCLPTGRENAEAVFIKALPLGKLVPAGSTFFLSKWNFYKN